MRPAARPAGVCEARPSLGVEGDEGVALLDDVSRGDVDGAHGAGALAEAPGSPSSSTPAAPRCRPTATVSPGADVHRHDVGDHLGLDVDRPRCASHDAEATPAARSPALARGQGSASRRLSSDGFSARASSTSASDTSPTTTVVVVAGLDDHVPSRVDEHRVPGVARRRLADGGDVRDVLDRPRRHHRPPVVQLARAGDPRRGHDEQRRPRRGRARGRARGSAGRSRSSARPAARRRRRRRACARRRRAGRTPCSRTSRRGGSCGTTRADRRGPRRPTCCTGARGSSLRSIIPATQVPPWSAARSVSASTKGPSRSSASGPSSSSGRPRSRW